MYPKAIITDLDNTLLRSDKTVSERTKAVLRRARERGIYVMAASARPERVIRSFCGDIEFDAVTALNGARILLPGSVLENTIPRESGELVLSGLVRLPGALISAEMSDGLYSNRPIPEWDTRIFDGFPRLPEGRLYKLLVSGVICREAEAALTGDTYLTPIEGGRIYQVMSLEATKWRGVQEMLSAYHLEPREAAYFGDDYDDIDPIKNCGLGVAMANSIPEVLSAADAVTGPSDEEGVAAFLERALDLRS